MKSLEGRVNGQFTSKMRLIELGALCTADLETQRRSTPTNPPSLFFHVHISAGLLPILEKAHSQLWAHTVVLQRVVGPICLTPPQSCCCHRHLEVSGQLLRDW